MEIYYNQRIIDLDTREMYDFYQMRIDPILSIDKFHAFMEMLIHKQEQELFLLLEPIDNSKIIATNLVRVNNVLYGTLIVDIPDYINNVTENDNEGLFVNETYCRMFLDKDLKEVHINNSPRYTHRPNALEEIVYTTEFGSRKISLPKNNNILRSLPSKSKVKVSLDIDVVEPLVTFDVITVHDTKNIGDYYYLLGKTDSKKVFYPYKNGLVKIDNIKDNKNKLNDVMYAFTSIR